MPTSAGDPARLLATLQRLLAIQADTMAMALTHACNAIAESLAADKVDAFLYDDSRDSLVAVGASTQPLSSLQKQLGLDVLPLTNGGRAVQVYTTGDVYRSGDVQADREELRGIREGLKIMSVLALPLDVAGERRGVLMVTSLARDHFEPKDEAFSRGVVHWVGVIAHRSQLIEEIRRNEAENGRRAGAEELVTVLAHDLRNYIAPVNNRLYTMRYRAENEGRGADLDDIESALRGTKALVDLISNLLDVARIDRGLFELETAPVDLIRLVRDAAGALARSDNEIRVNASDAVVVSGDAARIRQCIDNLLANAINHSPHGAPVDVLVAPVRDDGRAWGRIDIVDQGPGIPTDLIPRLFDRFVTGRGKEGGLGIGLYLARRIARAHGGDISVESTANSGAKFVVRLPLFRR